jgi:quinolinate synthase
MNTETRIPKILEFLQERLRGIEPEEEFLQKAELIAEINTLKREKSAVILGHNYMEAALYHTVADIRGDSLELARRANQSLDAERIVFCGVEFMAETAKILCPDKKVLIPSNKAGCSLASSITAQDVRELKARYPGIPVVTYINSYADVKAETDICCTSGNAAQVVRSLDSDTVIFIPDEYLAQNVARETGKKVLYPQIIPKSGDSSSAGPIQNTLLTWQGRCEVHEQFTVDDIARARSSNPDVIIMAHPECSAEVVEKSDFSGSTSRMIEFVRQSRGRKFLLLTECSMADNILAESGSREKEFLGMCSVRCPHMNQITLKQTRDCLLYDQFEIKLDETVRLKAIRSIERMLAI